MPLCEVPDGTRFWCPGELKRHVVKHVLEGRDERWHRVLDSEALHKARDEWSTGSFGEHCWKVAREYEQVVSTAIVKVCKGDVKACKGDDKEGGRWHHHVAEYVWVLLSIAPAQVEKVAKAQAVEAWPPEDRLWIVAKAFVSGTGLTPYVLWTGFRPWPGLSAKAHVRRAKERSENRRRQKCWLSLAKHYGVEDGSVSNR